MEENHQQSKSTYKNPLKIVLFGPESTGKTTLASDLATHFNTTWAAEYMRDYLQKKWNNRQEPCTPADLIPIAQGQLEAEKKATQNASKVVFCDTNLLQLKVYSEYYYNGFCPEEIIMQAKTNPYDLYLLLDVDVPWVPDDLRDRPEDREKLFKLFEKELKQTNKPYIVISGNYKQRVQKAKNAVDTLLKKAHEVY
ncbi:MAG: ATP-binding protein [Flavobacteriaceae bacterium]